MRIPEHLSRLYRDRRGFPVPYINIWSGEGTDRDWVIRHDRFLGKLAVFTKGQPGRGKPDFTKQAPQRQREVMMKGLCQVCRGQLPSGPRLLVFSSISVDDVVIEELGPKPKRTLTEPWLCEPCALFAMDRCPGLIRRQREEDFYLIAAIRWRLILSPSWIEGRLERYSKRVQPVLWIKVVVDEARVLQRNPGADRPMTKQGG